MELKEIEKKIKELIRFIREHNHNYYVLSKSEISDLEYDSLLKELQRLELEYPEFADPNSPTKRVGGEITKEFDTVIHKYPMLSLDNTYSKEEIREFDNRVRKMLQNESPGLVESLTYVCELKYDGVAIGLIYKNGKLQKAVTRGDGVQGDDVILNVKTIKTIPLVLKEKEHPSEFEIRGEIFLSQSSFEKINQDRIDAGESPFANPRNSAAGTLKMLDSRIVAGRNLDCYLYGMFGDSLPHGSHYSNMRAAKKWGFKVPDFTVKSKSLEGVFDFIDLWEKERNNIDVGIDGIVIKVDNYKLQEVLGFTAKSPRWAISFKYEPERSQTQLLAIDYQIGRTGAITPVAILEPVLLSGTTVKRASLHNADQINKLDVRVGDMVYVEKGGEIIPKIIGVELSKRPESSIPTRFLDECPDCGSALIKMEGEVAYYCPNDIGCAPQMKGKIEHFISRKAMDIDGIGEEIVAQLFDAGLIKDIADLYGLKYQDIIEMDRFAEKSSIRLLDGIEASKNIPFERVLFGLGIRYVGATVAKKLAFHFKNIQAVCTANMETLVGVEEIGERIAESVISYFENSANQELLDRLQMAGLNFETTENIALVGNKLDGLSFVVSGVFQHFSRDALKEAITINAGRVVGSISAKTSYVVAGDKMGPSKMEKAKKFNVEIISEEDFINLIS